MADARTPWKLNSFLDSLTLELDKAQDTLSVKGITRKLSYTVKDVSLELQLFPSFDGREIRFQMAKPGETGAAKIAFQLGSITDRQIREIANEPVSVDDVVLDQVSGLDDDARESLKRVGVTTVKDIERMERSGVDIQRVSAGKVDYRALADAIQRARRGKSPPSVTQAVLEPGDESGPVLALRGKNLALGLASAHDAPAAFLNGERVTVLSATADTVRIALGRPARGAAHELRVLLDPFTLLEMEIRS